MVKEYPTREPSGYLRRRNNVESFPVAQQRESLYTQDLYQTINNISVDDLLPYEKQARTIFDDSKLESLSDTIKNHGIRQPLTVIPSQESEGKFEVVSGERRLRAAKLAGLFRVPCIIIHDVKQAREISLIENLQREDLHPLEEGAAYKALLAEGIFASQQEIAQHLSVPKSQVSELIKLASLPSGIAKEIAENKVKDRATLREISSASSEVNMQTILRKHNEAKGAVKEADVRTNQAKILEVRLVGDSLVFKQASTRHLRADLLNNLRLKLLSIADELKIQTGYDT